MEKKAVYTISHQTHMTDLLEHLEQMGGVGPKDKEKLEFLAKTPSEREIFLHAS